jgi:hypothetical protein
MYWNDLDASQEYSKHEVVYKISPASHLSQSRNLATGPGETRYSKGLCAPGGYNTEEALVKPQTSSSK